MKFILVLGLLVILIAVALPLTVFWLVKSRYRDRAATKPPSLEAVRNSSSKLAPCARCGEERIIVSESEGMCAACYSALRTKVIS